MGQLAVIVQATAAAAPVLSEKALRRQIDRAVSRALVDGDYARLLLNNPTTVLNDQSCPPQQYLSLLSIQASNLVDFARQAQSLFWLGEIATFHPIPNLPAYQEELRPLAAVAAR